MTHAFDAIIVEVDVGNFNFLWQRLSFDGKAMIMRSDFHVTVARIFDRLIPAAMTKHQFESLAPESSAQQLVPKTDSKSRGARLGHALNFFDFSGHRRRIARTI